MGSFCEEPFLPVYIQVKGVCALKDSSQDLCLCGRDGVKLCVWREVEGEAGAGREAGVPRTAQGVQRQHPASWGARQDGGLGWDVSSPSGLLEVSLCLQSF